MFQQLRILEMRGNTEGIELDGLFKLFGRFVAILGDGSQAVAKHRAAGTKFPSGVPTRTVIVAFFSIRSREK